MYMVHIFKLPWLMHAHSCIICHNICDILIFPHQGMRSLAQEQGAGGVWFVGAYARLSVPLLENGVCAAVSVAAGIGASCPWNAEALPPAEEEAALVAKSKASNSGKGSLVLKCGVLGAAAAAVALVVARTTGQKGR